MADPMIQVIDRDEKHIRAGGYLRAASEKADCN
jgi:hypothetical protein